MSKSWMIKLLAVVCCSFSFMVNAQVKGIANFGHIVADIDRSMFFYGEVLGLSSAVPKTPFSDTLAIMQIGNTLGAQSRIATFSIPNAEFGIELIEYKDINRLPIQTRLQDPGAALLQLRVNDLELILDRLKESEGFVLTPSGMPIVVSDTVRIIFLKDPDGFYVELIEMSAPAGSSDAGVNILGGGIEIIVNSTAQTASFYEKGLGLSVNLGQSFDATPSRGDNVNVPGGAFKQSRTTITGTSVAMTFMEFKDVNRKPMNSRVQDPGTALLQLFVDDVAKVAAKLVAEGGTMVSVGGKPINMTNMADGTQIVIVRDPNNIFLELLTAR